MNSIDQIVSKMQRDVWFSMSIRTLYHDRSEILRVDSVVFLAFSVTPRILTRRTFLEFHWHDSDIVNVSRTLLYRLLSNVTILEWLDSEAVSAKHNSRLSSLWTITAARQRVWRRSKFVVSDLESVLVQEFNIEVPVKLMVHPRDSTRRKAMRTSDRRSNNADTWSVITDGRSLESEDHRVLHQNHERIIWWMLVRKSMWTSRDEDDAYKSRRVLLRSTSRVSSVRGVLSRHRSEGVPIHLAWDSM